MSVSPVIHLILEILRLEALHLHGAVQPSQHRGGRALDVVIEHEVLLLVPGGRRMLQIGNLSDEI